MTSVLSRYKDRPTLAKPPAVLTLAFSDCRYARYYPESLVGFWPAVLPSLHWWDSSYTLYTQSSGKPGSRYVVCLMAVSYGPVQLAPRKWKSTILFYTEAWGLWSTNQIQVHINAPEARDWWVIDCISLRPTLISRAYKIIHGFVELWSNRYFNSSFDGLHSWINSYEDN